MSGPRAERAGLLLPAAAALSVAMGLAGTLMLYERSAWSSTSLFLGGLAGIGLLQRASRYVDAYEATRVADGRAGTAPHALTAFSRGYLSHQAHKSGWAPRRGPALVWGACAPLVGFWVFLCVNAFVDFSRR